MVWDFAFRFTWGSGIFPWDFPWAEEKQNPKDKIMAATLRALRAALETDPESWTKESIARILKTIPRKGAISKPYHRFLEALYTLKYPIPNMRVLYSASFKELATTLGMRAIPPVHRELENQVFAGLYNHCLANDIGFGQLSRAQGFPAVTKSWIRGRLAKESPAPRDLTIARDPAKTKCRMLVAAKKFSYDRPVDVQILTELFHADVSLPPAHHKFIRQYLVNRAMGEVSRILGLDRLFGRKFMATLCPGDMEDLVYRGLYQYCVTHALDLSDLGTHPFPQITVRWFTDKLAASHPSPHDITLMLDPTNQKFRNLVASKHYDRSKPGHIDLLALLHAHRTQLRQPDYKFIKERIKCMKRKAMIPRSIDATKQRVDASVRAYFAKQYATTNSQPAKTKVRSRRRTVGEKKAMAIQKGMGFLGDGGMDVHAFPVFGFSGDHLVVDGGESMTVVLPKHVLKNFVEAEIGVARDKKPQIKRRLNPTRLLVRDQHLLLPNATVRCVRLQTGTYEAVLLERTSVEEKNAMQEQLFASYASRETDMLRELEDEELDELNTCYVDGI